MSEQGGHVAHELAEFVSYESTVGVAPRSGRPIRRTRYLVRCSCGWSVSGCDYISARRHWREHKPEED